MAHSSAPRSPSRADTASALGHYKHRAAAFPYLSASEECALAIRFRERGKLDAAHQCKITIA